MPSSIVNPMLQSLFKKIGKINKDIPHHNMVFSNYEGKNNHILRVMQVELSVGSTTRPTLFMMITPNANYNLLLGCEWIHGIGVIPSTLLQMVSI